MVRIVKKAEERKQEIIAAACELFLKQGFESTTMQDVMQKVNVAKGTIYHYFKSKEVLLEEVLDSIVDEHIKDNEKVFRTLHGNALEKIEQFIIGNIESTHTEELVENLHKPANAGMHTRLHAKLIAKQAHYFGELFAQGCREKIFSVKYPIETAEFILSAITFLTDNGIYSWSEEQLSRRAAAIPTLIEEQLGAPKGSFDFLFEILTNRHE